MVSPTVNVVRYSAIIGGIAYGIFHRRTLQKREEHHKEEAAYKHKQHLIEEAKKEYARRLTAGKDDVVTNPEDPNFDLEKFVAKYEKESA